MIKVVKDFPAPGLAYFFCVCGPMVAQIIVPKQSLVEGGGLDAVASLYSIITKQVITNG